jgi:hypothetical protein
LVVGKVVDILKNEYFKHQKNIKRRTPCFGTTAARTRLIEQSKKNGSINQLIKTTKEVVNTLYFIELLFDIKQGRKIET